jgi:hypothetical protein
VAQLPLPAAGLAHSSVIRDLLAFPLLLSVGLGFRFFMRVMIFLDLPEAECLRLSVPSRSSAKDAIQRALLLRQQWAPASSNVPTECDDVQAGEILAYAQSACESAVEKVRSALRLARLRNEARGGG